MTEKLKHGGARTGSGRKELLSFRERIIVYDQYVWQHQKLSEQLAHEKAEEFLKEYELDVADDTLSALTQNDRMQLNSAQKLPNELRETSELLQHKSEILDDVGRGVSATSYGYAKEIRNKMVLWVKINLGKDVSSSYIRKLISDPEIKKFLGRKRRQPNLNNANIK